MSCAFPPFLTCMLKRCKSLPGFGFRVSTKWGLKLAIGKMPVFGRNTCIPQVTLSAPSDLLLHIPLSTKDIVHLLNEATRYDEATTIASDEAESGGAAAGEEGSKVEVVDEPIPEPFVEDVLGPASGVEQLSSSPTILRNVSLFLCCTSVLI